MNKNDRYIAMYEKVYMIRDMLIEKMNPFLKYSGPNGRKWLENHGRKYARFDIITHIDQYADFTATDGDIDSAINLIKSFLDCLIQTYEKFIKKGQDEEMQIVYIAEIDEMKKIVREVEIMVVEQGWNTKEEK